MGSFNDGKELSTDKNSDVGFVDGDVESLGSVENYSESDRDESIWRRKYRRWDYPKFEITGVSVQKHKPIINDIARDHVQRDKLTMHDYSLDVVSLPRSVSFESITSGISVGTSASEERKGILKHVTSYSCSSSRRVSNENSRNPQTRPASEYAPYRRTAQQNGEGDEDRGRLCKSASASTPNRKVSFENKSGGGVNKRISQSSACSQRPRYQRQNSASNYDPALEKSQTFLHGQSKNFSRTNQYLTPTRPGLHKLQINYTRTNTDNNQLVIFADLVRTSHRKNYIIQETVDRLERRLFIRRNDPNRSTSYFVNMKMQDPIRKAKEKALRTIAEKQKRRQERIKKTTEELKLGYVPTSQTIKPLSEQEIELIRKCRYLRIDPKLQEC